MRLTILASSSSGNAAVVETMGKRILIDAGLSFRKLTGLLEQNGFFPQDISAVLLTHEHSDHMAGLSGFSAYRTPVYASAGTIAAAAPMLKKPINWRTVPANTDFRAEGVLVRSFTVPHDAMEPLGYSIFEEACQLTWALDMGYLTDVIKEELKRAHILVLESNYDLAMLEADTKRPFHLKQRIKGRHGHLGNDEAYKFLMENRQEHWREIYLAHLSGECNDPERLRGRYLNSGLSVEVVDPAGRLALA